MGFDRRREHLIIITYIYFDEIYSSGGIFKVNIFSRALLRYALVLKFYPVCFSYIELAFINTLRPNAFSSRRHTVTSTLCELKRVDMIRPKLPDEIPELSSRLSYMLYSMNRTAKFYLIYAIEAVAPVCASRE